MKHLSRDDSKKSGLPTEPATYDVKIALPRAHDAADSPDPKSGRIRVKLAAVIMWAGVGAAIFATLLWIGLLGWLFIRGIRFLF